MYCDYLQVYQINWKRSDRSNAYIKESGAIDVGADIFRCEICQPNDNKMTAEDIIHRYFGK